MSGRIRSVPGPEENRILGNAGTLSEKPELFLPVCYDLRCGKILCPIKSIRKDLFRIQSFRSDADALESASGHGSDFSKAYAGLLLIKLSGKLPYLASDPITGASFAVRGKAKYRFQIAFQNYDMPEKRLLAFTKMGCRIYASDTGLICCGRLNNLPEKFVGDLAKKLGLKTKIEGGLTVLECGHGRNLTISLLQANLMITICMNCASNKNTLGVVLERIAGFGQKDFRVLLDMKPECMSECRRCVYEDVNFIKIVAEYKGRIISDSDIIGRAKTAIRKRIRDSGPLFLVGEKCFGSNWHAFIDFLNPDAVQRKALETFLPKYKNPLVLKDASAGGVIEILWKEGGVEMLAAVLGNMVEAERIANVSGHPDQILHDIQKTMEHRKILEKYPAYEKLPELAGIADKIARTFKTGGKDAAVNTALSVTTTDTKIRSLIYGFLTALGGAAQNEWRFSKEEKEFGTAMADRIRNLLNSKPEEYNESFQNLLSYTGSSEKIELKKV